jgi:TPP-dependent pyruvate/acetoin dehydrogenase alpha subunit
MMNRKIFLELYKKTLFIRTVEDQISKEYKKQEMRCPIHLSIGQEAAAVGLSVNLKKKDKMYSTHRCHAHYLAKGGSLNKMIAEIYGKETGCCKGRGGSMHLFDENVGLSNSIPLVGSNIPLAVGNAFANKLNKKSNIAVAMLGDGVVEEGVFHESMNFAILKKLPVLFFCENNFYSVMTHLKERQPKKFLEKIGKLYDLKVDYLNGNKVDEVYVKSKKMINYIKNKRKPGLIVLNTHRYKEHCGPNEDIQLGYRNIKEFDYWKKNDPLIYCEKILKKKYKVTEIILEKIKQETLKKCNNAFIFAKKSKLPKHAAAKEKVYSN